MGTLCCLVGLATVFRRGGHLGANGRARTEPTDLLAVFKAPEIQLAGVPNGIFAGGKHHGGENVMAGLSSKVVQLDSVKPLLDGRGTQNVAEVVAALQTGKPQSSTLTLHGVPTEVTITLPEDVTINRAAALEGRIAGAKTSKLSEGDDSYWAYRGNMGPADWGNQGPWTICREGEEQSPINIVAASAKGDAALPPMTWLCAGEPCVGDYNASDPSPSPSSVKIAYDGHTIVLSDFAGDGDPAVTWKGKEMKLEKILLHTPSEHSIDGLYYALEVQLYAKAAEGGELVVAALYNTGEGEESAAWVTDVVSVVSPCHLSTDPAQCRLSEAPTHLTSQWSFKAMAIELEPLLNRYYSYDGSLTQPPCTEGVSWVVGAIPGHLAQQDWTNLAAAQAANNRPRQRIGTRLVTLHP